MPENPKVDTRPFRERKSLRKSYQGFYFFQYEILTE
jgi:hypothetical protein